MLPHCSKLYDDRGMSEQEQDDIASKAMLDYHKAKQKLACLEKKASDAQEALEFVKNAFENPEQYTLLGDRFHSTSGGKYMHYPSDEDVTSVFNELVEVKKEINELANSLQRMGYDVSS